MALVHILSVLLYIVNTSHCFTKKVLEMGGEATVTRSLEPQERGDADGLDDEGGASGNARDAEEVQTSDEEAER